MHLKALAPVDPKWSTTDRIIESWLQDRQALIVLFNQLCALAPFKPPQATGPILIEFCTALIDYVSAGQFEVFEKIFEANGRANDPSPSFDKSWLLQLFKTTINALDFNDRYHNSQDYTDLSTALSFLGERIADRLELEDHLIDLYMQATR